MSTDTPVEVTPRRIGPVWLRLHSGGPPPPLACLKHHREALKRDGYFARLRGRAIDRTAPRYLAAVAKRERRARA